MEHIFIMYTRVFRSVDLLVLMRMSLYFKKTDSSDTWQTY